MVVTNGMLIKKVGLVMLRTTLLTSVTCLYRLAAQFV